MGDRDVCTMDRVYLTNVQSPSTNITPALAPEPPADSHPSDDADAHSAGGRFEWDSPLFQTALTQFDETVPAAGVADDIAERLRHPERSLMVSVPTRLDDGSVQVFAGYRVQHSTVLGPTKGGIRYD